MCGFCRGLLAAGQVQKHPVPIPLNPGHSPPAPPPLPPQLLEALSPGLGWKVFARYPEDLVQPFATELWAVLAGYLFTLGFAPDKVGKLTQLD